MSDATTVIGLYGLGVMGSSLALNIAENGYPIAVSNRSEPAIEALITRAGPLREKIVAGADLANFVSAVKKPRAIVLMIKSGPPVDQTIEKMLPLLDEGDTLIDAGNADFHDTVRRSQMLAERGIDYLGIGVSGGEEGARHGPSIMVGGSYPAWERLRPLLQAIAAKFEGEPCCAYMGADGAGHFVKTIHNGIEYADMQMIAEIYGLARDGFGWPAQRIGEMFAEWDRGRLDSYLIEITAAALAARDEKTGEPMVDVILDTAGQKGTGRWSVIEAVKLGVPATAMVAAVAARSLSAQKEDRQAMRAVFGSLGNPSALENASLTAGEMEAGLYAGKIAAYAQGFAVLAAASEAYRWQLPLDTIARIWRAGCIIRSVMLDTIATAFAVDPMPVNLMLAPSFAAAIRESDGALRKLVSSAITAGLPVPALAASLGYIDQYRQQRGTANLIQAQRDFFGAHGFARIDASGDHHGPW